MKDKDSPPRVFFNASVILAGLRSPSGGSAKLLRWIKESKITGLVSETIVDEVNRHAKKLGIRKKEIRELINDVFLITFPPPKKKLVKAYFPMVIDCGDAHVLASASQLRVDFLVSLDKKHLLILRRKVKAFKIASPGQLIEELS